ncbi:hypothetical protein B5K08_23865 [Rhizobium leguminosarum bv. trifolii]|uniref:Uncharacterized protein n=1 Tax=Rhizobium leguminosarum bv. trifolii TaxID=386 RepID=A0A3E1B6C8_RHILT|nr:MULTISPECIES: hypothetical protein [Rhizobium]EJT01342.1 hypothetical protein RCCGE510_28846 [Rhizobium sp. CCGE 510]RFB83100.1 hypothetical protein B5K11_35350 [Rhizobium leguminosarum bv. trifolii]RFB86372.1 hypothetical protein B5K08_23865 [Rhizobium leguminosarum bv. trifolii]RFB86630.1 hypothetical protein B5K10_23850 [Rhizobium leguminosarum bv. trifolii]
MKTLEDPKNSSESRTVDIGGLVKQYESAKLVQEMQNLIKKKGLKVDLVLRDDGLSEPLANGCSSCTVCPCMICW